MPRAFPPLYLEYGETFQECAVREMLEETNLHVEVQDFVFLSEAIAPDRSRHIVNIYVTAKVLSGELKLGDEPVLAGVEYKSLDEIDQLTLFPPIGKTVIESLPTATKGSMRFLGNLWE